MRCGVCAGRYRRAHPQDQGHLHGMPATPQSSRRGGFPHARSTIGRLGSLHHLNPHCSDATRPVYLPHAVCGGLGPERAQVGSKSRTVEQLMVRTTCAARICTLPFSPQAPMGLVVSRAVSFSNHSSSRSIHKRNERPSLTYTQATSEDAAQPVAAERARLPSTRAR